MVAIRADSVAKNRNHQIMAEGPAAAPKPSSSVKLVLLGEAAVGKVRPGGFFLFPISPSHHSSGYQTARVSDPVGSWTPY